jgi:phosphoribosylformylglycinamidine synthase PurS subunit
VARYRVSILVRPRSGVMDPQAEAVGESLGSLGYRGTEVEWVGRVLTMTIEAADADAAEAIAGDMCNRILVNPNLETHEVTVTAAGDGRG